MAIRETQIDNKLTWVHLTYPSQEDFSKLKSYINAHPIVLDELLSASDRTRVDTYPEYIFMVYHFPIYDTKELSSRRAEIDIIASKETLITVSYEELEPIQQFERDLETRLKKKEISSAAHLLYHLLSGVNDYSVRQLKHVEKKVNYVGEKLFKRQDRKLLEEISYIKRDLLEFSIVAVPQRSTLESLLQVASDFWGPRFRPYFLDLVGDFSKIHYLLENLKTTIESYSETVSQIFGFKTSEIIRRFSILGFLTFPLILYATIALQPKVEAGIINTANDFWIQFGVIAVIIVTAAFFFRKKGWL
ncbi:MAG: CorA family divalent cation transporter [Patescibacteria group bacterium]